ncbi:AcrR family transcriptional regulator [Cryobacterium mesophilum]|nr:TetR/AcrR family transcriptional regulator [Terrimesophilobacter mesophilus]MBB5631846.1 AcrR family transcriptional regulator [Terrimesophilobacter mesophilus]
MAIPDRQESRREQMLRAATTAFAQRGYFGTSTARVAQEAGVSQPYVIQVFGTKEALFLEVLDRAGDIIVRQMESIGLDTFDLSRFTDAFRHTVLEESVMFVLQQGFAASAVPAVGAYVRGLLARMYGVLVDHANATPEEARDYLARGLLINTVLAMGYRDNTDEYPWVQPLIEVVLGGEEG